MSNLPEISIIVPTLNRPVILQETILHLLEAIDGITAEIIIINDNKHSEISDEIKTNPRIKTANNPSQGAASARNAGVKLATADLLLFLDDDILVSPENIQTTISLHKNKQKVAYNFNWIYPQHLQNKLPLYQFGRFLMHHNLISYQGWVRDINWISEEDFITVPKLAAFYFSISKADFLSVGGFNETFTQQGVEDDELSFRLKQSGVHMMIAKHHYVLHNEIDRQDLSSRLKRLHASAVNKRRAFDMGLLEYKITYSKTKLWLLNIALRFNGLIFAITQLIPNLVQLDFVYFRMVKILFAVSVYKGYEQK